MTHFFNEDETIDTCPQENIDDRAAASAREGEDHGAQEGAG